MSDTAKDVSIAGLISRLEAGTEEAFKSTASSFCVKTAGKVIRMWYGSRESAEKAKEGCRKYLVSDAEDYCATFKYWEEDFSRYLPMDYIKNGKRLHSNDDGRVKVVMGYFISCADYHNRTFYYCTHPSRHFIGAHAMVNPYYLWGMCNDMILTHSACVGVDGKGVLLVANGGGGKSTLAVGGLMHGLDFVSDDYTMLSGSGRLVGMPLYSNIGLTPESYDMLKPSYPVDWIHEANKNKKFMDISGEDNLVDEILIQALVAPKLTASETRIYEIDSRPLIMTFHNSSMKQILSLGNGEYVRKFIARLSHLKAYQIELGTDVHNNAEFLRNFIRMEL